MKTRSSTSSASQGVGEGWAAVSTLIGGFVFWGGVGWLLDHWWGTRFLTPIGVILGMALGIYAVVMRFGRAPVPGAVTSKAVTSKAVTSEAVASNAVTLEAVTLEAKISAASGSSTATRSSTESEVATTLGIGSPPASWER